MSEQIMPGHVEEGTRSDATAPSVVGTGSSDSSTAAVRPLGTASRPMLIDAACYPVAALSAVSLRLDFAPPPETLIAGLTLGVAMALGQLVVGWGLGLYRGRYRYGSFDEVFAVSIAAAIVGVLSFVMVLGLQHTGVPRSVPLLTAAFALLAMVAVRFARRWWEIQQINRRHVDKTLIVGAGESGEQLVRAMIRDDGTTYRPVGFLDDDPSKRRLRMHGVPVIGSTDQLQAAINTTGAHVVVVAISRIEADRLLHFDSVCRQAGATLRVLPSTSDIVGGAVTLGDVSDVSDEDLLGRRPIDADEESIATLLEGKVILITGAGGSIGSELARQVHRYRPQRVVLLDRDESALHAMQLSIDGRALLDNNDLVLADIRDSARMREVFALTRPDIVFHAAALKHMPLLENAPAEAWKTNVLGTRTVLEESRHWRVPILVNISTDKAAAPENVLGYSKRITERLTAGAANESSHFVSVRFGNVLGSRGSVLPAFRAQIASGGPVTVTDPEVTRYFMTVSEAVHLVLQAAALRESSGVLVLDMGEPRRIDDVARKLIAKSGRDIRIEYTGLRPGEKLHEVLVDPSEDARPTHHSLICEVSAPPLDLNSLPEVGTDAEALTHLVSLTRSHAAGAPPHME